MSLKSTSEYVYTADLLGYSTLHIYCSVNFRGNFGILNFSIKRMEKFDLYNYLITTMIPQVEWFSFFFGRIEDNKKTIGIH